MNNGPRLNDFTTNFTTRDSLGVESVATSISAEICPIINTVTPRPFYWAFMCWIYYDYYRSVSVEKRDYKSFDQFLKRQDYFFVVSQLLNDESDRTNLVGTTKAIENINNNTNDLFECDRSYFKTQFGGMQYFNAGLFTMGYIFYKTDENGKTASFPTLTGECEKMALAFEEVIKELINNNHKVMMVGDGINDAPSLASSTIGVSVNNGTDIAGDSADVILMQDDLSKIISLFNISKKTVKIIKQNLFWAFIYNILMIPLAMGLLKSFGISITPMIASISMTISSLCVVFNSLRLRRDK